jgi:heme/copper-type cytochrome/quinol oxidase subunit 2
MVVRSYHSFMSFNVKAVTSARYTKWLRVQQASVWIHPSPVPKLPSGVNANSSSSGGDFYGD